jgi:hypothetical protein
MNTYLCKLVQTLNGKSVVKKVFYRQGNSEKEVKEGLEMFYWPKGKWQIELS